MHRIYFDPNEGLGDQGYGLWLPRSSRDIEPIAGDLHDGLHVIIYQTRELEMEAVLKFDRMYGAWIARPVAGTTKIYPEAFR